MTQNKYWTDRRTVRQYTDREIDDAMLRDMLTKASHAPTTGNMQLYSVIVTRDPAMKHRLAPAHFNQPQVEGCDVVLTFCADFNRFGKWCELRDAKPGFDNFQMFICGVLDTALFAQQFNTIAELNSLGCCYLGTTTYNAAQIADTLELPPMVIPVTTLTVGYPVEGSTVESDRIPVGGIMHDEVYRDYTPAMIDDVYGQKEEREDSRRFVEENNKSTLAQVFTDIRYPRATNEQFSKLYLDFIRRAGIQF